MISIIIPTLNEEDNITELLNNILENNTKENIEILVIDGGSTDNTVLLAERFDVQVYKSPNKGRATQMNFGAGLAKFDILYFVHADVIPHKNFYHQITTAVQNGVDLGCYSYKFKNNRGLLKLNSYLTKFNATWAGGGDQTLFITKDAFKILNGFNNEYIIMEDFDLIKRAKQAKMRFEIINEPIVVSDRKYTNNSWLRVQIANITIVAAWKLGASQKWMKKKYKQMLN